MPNIRLLFLVESGDNRKYFRILEKGVASDRQAAWFPIEPTQKISTTVLLIYSSASSMATEVASAFLES